MSTATTATTVIHHPPPPPPPPSPPPPPPPPSPPPQDNGTAEAPAPSSGTRSTLATIKLMFSSHIKNGEPNPVHVAIATRGYDIQSRVLRIPDRFGWFVRGPPLRSAFEGHAFVYATLYLVFAALLFAGCVAGMELGGYHSLETPITFAVLYIVIIAIFWVAMFYSPRRKRGFYSGERLEPQTV